MNSCPRRSFPVLRTSLRSTIHRARRILVTGSSSEYWAILTLCLFSCRCFRAGGRWIALLLFVGPLLSGCATPRLLSFHLDMPAQTLSTIGASATQDGRQRFREIFCELLRQRGAPAAECESRLLRLRDEPDASPSKETLPALDPRLVVVVVPGLFGECLSGLIEPFHLATRNLSHRGYRIHQYLVPGVSGGEANAAHIAENWRELQFQPEDRIVVLAHSKGTVDMLRFLVDFPEKAAQITALVSVAGAVNGSPLASSLGALFTELSREIPRMICDTGDLGAFDSLKRNNRLTWLAQNSLPDRVRYYSVAGIAGPGRVSAGLQPSYELLADIDPRNDGMLLFYDQVIPGATLLGYANADHWAIVYPVAELRPELANSLATRNDYPREVLLEAILLYLSEDLARHQ